MDKTCNNYGRKYYFFHQCKQKKKQKKDHTHDANNANIVKDEIKEIVVMVSEMQIGIVTKLIMVVVAKSSDGGIMLVQLSMYIMINL